MKNRFIYIGFLFFLTVNFLSCQKELETPDHLKNINAQTPYNLKYENVDIGYVDTIFVPNPTWDGTSYVNFFLDSVSSDVEDFDQEQFQNLIQVDRATGEIILTSTANVDLGKQAYGNYVMKIRMDYKGGSVYQDSACTVQIMELPFTFDYSEAPSEIAFTKEGLFATPKFNDLEGYTITEITYSPAIEGISIDTLGQLSKTGLETPVGDYTISLQVETDRGPKTLSEVYSFTLNPIAIDLTYEDTEVDFMTIGEIASPTISTEEEIDLADITYSITDNKGNETGDISIDENTGIISKNGFNVPNGTTYYNVTLTTPVGELVVEDALKMIVADKPVITYLGNGQVGDQLTKAKLSPWTAMNASINSDPVTENPVYKLKSTPFEGISIDATTGEISVVENSNIPDGNYPIIVTVEIMLDGETYPIDFEVFEIEVTTTWEDHFFTDFEFASDAQQKFKIDSDNAYGFRSQEFGDYHFVRTNNGVKLEWVAGKRENFGETVTKSAMSNVFEWSSSVDRGRSGLIKNIDVEADWRRVEVSFTEQYNNQTPVFDRYVMFGYNNDPATVYNESDWTTINGLTWSSSANWPGNANDLDERNLIELTIEGDDLVANQTLNVMSMIEVTEKASGVSLAWGLDNYYVKVAKTFDVEYE
ncbi:hypothetical protein [Flammeovirga sp. EKP202]|uniref:hypothetical protein n=1 Tax=Flammeovirga sp. EKP202 TaxID=2770592 RepID=UPI00165F3C1F|nr:hypothetical protein [Flammeovirga sp. EKP202]MBD0401911.1 hypothetical protein [Flammeovirga sp. EKP202]